MDYFIENNERISLKGFRALEQQPTVHVKLWATKGWTPCAMVAIGRDNALVAPLVNGKPGKVVEVWLSNVREHWHVTRKVIKVMKFLNFLARNLMKAEARRVREEERKGRRADTVGCCPACWGDYVVKERRGGKLAVVLHGYQRPGVGYTIGRCFGVGYAPLEVSTEGLDAFICTIKSQLDGVTEALAELPTVGSVFRAPRWSGDEGKLFKRGEDGFDKALADRKWRLEGDQRALKSIHNEAVKRRADWRPQSWPRV